MHHVEVTSGPGQRDVQQSFPNDSAVDDYCWLDDHNSIKLKALRFFGGHEVDAAPEEAFARVCKPDVTRD